MWLGTSATALLQIKDNIDTNTTYTLTKSGSTIQLKNQSGTVVSSITDANTTYDNATQSAAGLMSGDDKKKLDGIASGANNITVDSALSSTSTNPVQNKVVNSALAGKAASNHNHDSSYVKKSGDTMTGALKINGTAASQPLVVRGIVGQDGNGNVSELHLQFGANNVIKLGNDGSHSISADGSKYTGKAATAGVADSANAVAWANVTGKPATFTPSSHTHTKSQITDFPTSMPASDVSAWAKASTKPSYSWSEITGKPSSFTPASHTHTSLVAQSSIIGNSTDWTSITTSGIYTVQISDTTNAKNYPSGAYLYGDLYVQENNGHLSQTYISHQGDVFVRQSWNKNTSGVWQYGDWYKQYSTKNKPAWGDVTGKPSFATVATSGSYNDLSNKPTIPTTLKNPNALTISLNGNSQGAYDGSTAKSFNITASSVGAAAASHNHDAGNITSGTLGIDRIPNVNSKVTSVDVSKLSGVIDSSHLPSYVDDVLEYDSLSKFPTEGETGKIYTAKDTNKIYRWSGTAYVVISETLALGETSSTAYRGDRGAAAYKHAVTNKGAAFSSGLYKITTNAEGHVTAATAVAKSDITGLGIPAQDTVYTHPTTSGNKHIPSGGSSGQILRWSADGTAVWGADNNTWQANTVSQNGYVTAPTTSNANKVWKTDASGVPGWRADANDNTWRGIQNNLTSTSTTDSLSAAQGKVLNDKFASYVPTSRTINSKALTGNITLSASDVGAATSSHNHDSTYLKLSGGTVTGQITSNTIGGSWILDRGNATIKSGAPASGSYKPVVSQKTSNGNWSIGTLYGDDRLVFNYSTDTNYNAGTNTTSQVWLPTTGGTIALTSQIPSVGNGTVTITQNGTSKGTFTMNQSGNTTIALTDSNTTYSTGTSSALGLTKLYTATGSATDGTMTQSAITSALNGKAASSHTHSYAGSSSAGGSANSAVKLDTATAGSATQPVYFTGGKPSACTYTLGKSVPSDAVFTDTNTWRGIQNNLTSTSTTDSLAAAQGKALKDQLDNTIVISSTQPSASACKIWVKI